MKMTKQKLLSLALGVAAVLPLFARADADAPGMPGGPAGFAGPGGPGGPGGMHQPYVPGIEEPRGARGDGPAFGGGMGYPQFRGLQLSEAQEDKVFAIVHAQAPYLREQQKAEDKAMRALHELRHAEKFDDAAAARLAQAAAQAHANLMLSDVRTQQKLLAVLTPEQRKQLDDRRPRMPRP